MEEFQKQCQEDRLERIKIIESPREGMQSLQYTIPLENKVKYLDALLKVGFDTVELGSIVSARFIPPLADTLEVIQMLDYGSTHSHRMILVVNKKGAEIIAERDEITHISYPFSISPAFLKMNLNTTIEKAIETVGEIAEICEKKNKNPVIYISMAFGNTYGDDWSMDILRKWVNTLYGMGIRTIVLSNVSIEINSAQVSEIFSDLVPRFPDAEFGLHLHTTNRDWYENINVAYESGCRRFDSVIHGWGGCPMSGRELLGNLKTENLIEFNNQNRLPLNLNPEALEQSYNLASVMFH
jgi:hydroxymethylglutaryl-CoA lyase